MHRILKNKKELIEKFITKSDVVLDVGFLGQGITMNDANWPHMQLRMCAKDVYGIDLEFDRAEFPDEEHYRKISAEKFDFGEIKFDVIVAGDIIEHLSNPGLFLDSAAQALQQGGVLIMSTPNCFNLWNLIGKVMRYEPTVNADHTCYFSEKTITRLLDKNDWVIDEILYLYSLDTHYTESWKKKIQNILYWFLSKFTTKFLEPMVVIARKRSLPESI
ncbi:MAG: class I SAM-dependent methyltransferase [Minisyncoccia bacterium]